MLQSEALDILKLGHNVYLTGAAGSGKTHVLNTYISYLHEHGINVGITASTGIAATHINGMTIHSWAGIGIQDELSQADVDKIAKRASLKKRIEQTKVLIIDEVSMLHGKRLDIINMVCKALKGSDKPFGGLQVVLCGDLFQLPPVTRGGEPDFVFQSKAWKNMNLHVCYLTEQYRQEDQSLLDILSAIRANDIDESHFEQLRTRFDLKPKTNHVTRLYTHNKSVDTINIKELQKLSSEKKIYSMTTSGRKKAVEALMATCLAPESLELRVGAKVMFVANNFADGYVNGSLGEVIAFSDNNFPIVQTANRRIEVTVHTWKMQDGDKTIAEASQLPLRLAWAITVHKSQGMSLDAAEMDLSKSFEPGMGYVALSRVKSLDGLFINGINNTALIVHPTITALDEKFREKANTAQQQLQKIDKKSLESHHERVRLALRSEEDKALATYDTTIFDKLASWRSSEAKKQSAPAYIVFSDKTLKYLAAIKPKNNSELSKINGIGAQKLERYGKDVLAIINT